jgi:hypothetical protein
MSSQNSVLQHGGNEPSNRDGQPPTAPQPPAAAPIPENVSKAALLGLVKGTAMGFGSKLGKWFWDKGKDLFTDDHQ